MSSNVIRLPAGIRGRDLAKAKKRRVRAYLESHGVRFGGAIRSGPDGKNDRVSAPLTFEQFQTIMQEQARKRAPKPRRLRPWWHPNAPRRRKA